MQEVNVHRRRDVPRLMVLPGVRRVYRQAERYGRAIVWLMRFVIKRFGIRVATPLIAGPLGLFLVGGGVGLGITIAAALEGDAPVALPGFSLAAPERQNLFWLVSGVATLVVSGAVLVYQARKAAISIAAGCKTALAEEVLNTRCGRLGRAGDYVSDKHAAKAMRRLLVSDPQRLSLALRRGLESPVSAATVLFGAIGLFLLEPVAATMMVGFLLLVIPIYYLVNVDAVRASKRLEAVSPRVRTAASELDQALARRPAADRSSIRREVASHEAFQHSAEAWSRRLIAVARADLISQGLIAVAFLALLGYLGRGVLDGRLGFSVAGGFVVVLRFMLGGVRNLARAFTVFSRYYPSVFRLQQYVEASCGSAPAPRELVFKARREAVLQRSRRRVKVSTSNPIGITSTFTPTRFTAGFFGEVFQRASRGVPATERGPHVAVMIVPQRPSNTSTLRTVFDVSDHIDLTTLDLAREDRIALAIEGIHGLDEPHDADTWLKVPRATWVRLALSATQLLSPTVIVVEADAWPHVAERLARTSGPSLAVLVWSPSVPLSDAPLDHVVVAADGSLIAHGSPTFVRDHWSAIQGVLASVHGALTSAESAADDEDDEA